MEQTYKTAFILDDDTRVTSFKIADSLTEFTDRDNIEQCLGLLLEKAFDVKVKCIEHYQDDNSEGDEENETD